MVAHLLYSWFTYEKDGDFPVRFLYVKTRPGNPTSLAALAPRHHRCHREPQWHHRGLPASLRLPRGAQVQWPGYGEIFVGLSWGFTGVHHVEPNGDVVGCRGFTGKTTENWSFKWHIQSWNIREVMKLVQTKWVIFHNYMDYYGPHFRSPEII